MLQPAIDTPITPDRTIAPSGSIATGTEVGLLAGSLVIRAHPRGANQLPQRCWPSSAHIRLAFTGQSESDGSIGIRLPCVSMNSVYPPFPLGEMPKTDPSGACPMRLVSRGAGIFTVPRALPLQPNPLSPRAVFHALPPA